MTATGARGFTLIEIVLATALLAAGLALAYGTVRTATGSVQRAEQVAVDSDRLRAVQGFLRRQLQVAQPAPFDREPATGVATLFEGAAAGIRFVGPMPGWLARGGVHLQQLDLVRDGDTLRLEFSHRLLLGDTPVDDPEPRPPEVLLRGIADAAFAYRRIQEDGSVGDWEERGWDTPAELPAAVALRLRFADGRRWPDLEVPLMMSSAIPGAPTAPLEPP